MNTKGVEDGMSDEQAVRQGYERVICVYGVTRWEILEYKGAHHVLGIGKSPAEAWSDARAKLPKAQPAVPVEERTQNKRVKFMCPYDQQQCDYPKCLSTNHNYRDIKCIANLSAAKPIPKERTGTLKRK